jgi:hypothetical protein
MDEERFSGVADRAGGRSSHLLKTVVSVLRTSVQGRTFLALLTRSWLGLWSEVYGFTSASWEIYVGKNRRAAFRRIGHSFDGTNGLGNEGFAQRFSGGVGWGGGFCWDAGCVFVLDEA